MLAPEVLTLILQDPKAYNVSVSLLLAAVLSIVVQGLSLPQVLRILFAGYRSSSPALAPMVDGGGVVSMLSVIGIILISSCYAGIFRGTGLLDGAKHSLIQISRRSTPFGATFCAAVVTCAISCNQTLAAMLTNQLCSDLSESKDSFAIDLEDTVIVIAPLIPWSIAGGVPLASLGAPLISLPLACYLYLLPLWRLLQARRRG